MTDTTQEVREQQLKIWLKKKPMERLVQFLHDNEVLFRVWKQHNEVKNKEQKIGKSV